MAPHERDKHPEGERDKEWRDERLMMDEAHTRLIHGLACSLKPNRILEFGLGGGASTDALVAAAAWNKNFPKFLCVDNWSDLGGKIPGEAARRYAGKVDFWTDDEGSYVHTTRNTFDFIVSDADHASADRWWLEVYDRLLEPGGVLIYHDIDTVEGTNPNLLNILTECHVRELTHWLFNKNSRPGERCQRGLLVIFKDPC